MVHDTGILILCLWKIQFADIVGFTAWSSVRDPCQVFTLLETVYHAFDEIAKRRRIFKVETIGDCYGNFDCLLLAADCDTRSNILFL